MSNLEIILVFITLVLSGLLFVSVRKQIATQAELALSKASSLSDHGFVEKFQLLANQVLESQTGKLVNLTKMTIEKEQALSSAQMEKTKSDITNLVDPLKALLTQYQEQVSQIEHHRQRSYTTVENELKRVADLSNKLSFETSALKNALKRPHVRGRWGEVQLKNCIDIAGMSEYADVSFQSQTTLNDGSRLIPDMIVRMPGDRVVVVDAKTPIEAFIASLEAQDDETRVVELARHGRHIKEHIKKLSQKEYQSHVKNSADFTILFLPNESFLYAALENETDLMEFAIQRKILIATPPTLIGLLKVIRYGWNEQRLTENAQKISELGTELHKRVAEFTEGYLAIGTQLERAQKEYQTGLSRLQSRVIVQAKKLEAYGAKSTKEIDDPAHLLDSAN